MRTLISVLSMIALLGCTPENNYEEEGALGSSGVNRCLSQNSLTKLSSKDYKDTCAGKSVYVTGYVKEVLSKQEFKITLIESYYSETFRAMARNTIDESWRKGIEEGSKIEVRGILSERDWLGNALIHNANIKYMPLTKAEIDAFKEEKNEEREAFLAKLESMKIHTAYLHCADKFELSKLGTECPRPSPDLLGGHVDEDGKVYVEGICYFGKTNITFVCEGYSKSAEVTSFEVHGGLDSQ